MSAINNYILKTPSPRTRKPPNPVETLNWKSLKVDLDNNTAHFEGIEIMFNPKSFFKIRDYFMTYREEEERAEVFRCVKKQPTYVIKQAYHDLMDEIDRIKRRIRLTPSTLFLADFISKNYIHDRWSKRQEVNRLEMIDIAHASLFLASKLRERDIYCPMIPHILQAGDNITTREAVKKTEIEISQFYEWNLAFLSFYDYLEQFMCLGFLLRSDFLRVGGKRTSAGVMTYANQLEQLEEQAAVINEATRSDSEDGRIKEEKRIPLVNMPTHEANLLMEFIERRCLDLAIQLSENYFLDPTAQKEIAYLIIALARKENSIRDYDSPTLRRLFKVKIRDEADFQKTIDRLSKECPNKAHVLQFDIAVREYDEEGREIPCRPPPPPLPRNHNRWNSGSQRALAGAQKLPPGSQIPSGLRESYFLQNGVHPLRISQNSQFHALQRQQHQQHQQHQLQQQGVHQHQHPQFRRADRPPHFPPPGFRSHSKPRPTLQSNLFGAQPQRTRGRRANSVNTSVDKTRARASSQRVISNRHNMLARGAHKISPSSRLINHLNSSGLIKIDNGNVAPAQPLKQPQDYLRAALSWNRESLNHTNNVNLAATLSQKSKGTSPVVGLNSAVQFAAKFREANRDQIQGARRQQGAANGGGDSFRRVSRNRTQQQSRKTSASQTRHNRASKMSNRSSSQVRRLSPQLQGSGQPSIPSDNTRAKKLDLKKYATTGPNLAQTGRFGQDTGRSKSPGASTSQRDIQKVKSTKLADVGGRTTKINVIEKITLDGGTPPVPQPLESRRKLADKAQKASESKQRYNSRRDTATRQEPQGAPFFRSRRVTSNSKDQIPTQRKNSGSRMRSTSQKNRAIKLQVPPVPGTAEKPQKVARLPKVSVSSNPGGSTIGGGVMKQGLAQLLKDNTERKHEPTAEKRAPKLSAEQRDPLRRSAGKNRKGQMVAGPQAKLGKAKGIDVSQLRKIGSQQAKDWLTGLGKRIVSPVQKPRQPKRSAKAFGAVKAKEPFTKLQGGLKPKGASVVKRSATKKAVVRSGSGDKEDLVFKAISKVIAKSESKKADKALNSEMIVRRKTSKVKPQPVREEQVLGGAGKVNVLSPVSSSKGVAQAKFNTYNAEAIRKATARSLISKVPGFERRQNIAKLQNSITKTQSTSNMNSNNKKIPNADTTSEKLGSSPHVAETSFNSQNTLKFYKESPQSSQSFKAPQTRPPGHPSNIINIYNKQNQRSSAKKPSTASSFNYKKANFKRRVDSGDNVFGGNPAFHKTHTTEMKRSKALSTVKSPPNPSNGVNFGRAGFKNFRSFNSGDLGGGAVGGQALNLQSTNNSQFMQNLQNVQTGGRGTLTREQSPDMGYLNSFSSRGNMLSNRTNEIPHQNPFSAYRHQSPTAGFNSNYNTQVINSLNNDLPQKRFGSKNAHIVSNLGNRLPKYSSTSMASETPAGGQFGALDSLQADIYSNTQALAPGNRIGDYQSPPTNAFNKGLQGANTGWGRQRQSNQSRMVNQRFGSTAKNVDRGPMMSSEGFGGNLNNMRGNRFSSRVSKPFGGGGYNDQFGGGGLRQSDSMRVIPNVRRGGGGGGAGGGFGVNRRLSGNQSPGLNNRLSMNSQRNIYRA